MSEHGPLCEFKDEDDDGGGLNGWETVKERDTDLY